MASNGLAQGLDAKITAVADELIGAAMGDLVAQIAAGLGGAPSETTPPAARKSGATAKANRAPAGRAARSGGSSTKPVCNVVGCGRPQVSRGGCSRHYQLARRGQLPMPVPPGTPTPTAGRSGRKAKRAA